MGSIRRYGSRKLYDPGARRYVSLEEIAQRIRGGEEIEVRESASGQDVTTQTLAQILLEEGKSGRGQLPAQLLHDLVRVSGQRAAAGSSPSQGTMNRLMRASLHRLLPQARRDVSRLEEGLKRLEQTLASAKKRPAGSSAATRPPATTGGARARTAKKTKTETTTTTKAKAKAASRNKKAT